MQVDRFNSGQVIDLDAVVPGAVIAAVHIVGEISGNFGQVIEVVRGRLVDLHGNALPLR